MKKLQLADNEKCDNKNVDLLIGADVYWQIVTGEIKKGDNSGLIAINSVLGWLISGPIKSENQSSSVNVTTSHVMKIECEERSDVILTESLQKFWDLDTIGISEGELSVYDEFMEDIEFINGKYQVKLPFKEGHPMLADNFNLSLRRLEQLKGKLSRNEELLKSYVNVIKEQLEQNITEEVKEPGIIGNVTYLPHKEVIKDEKSSTKLRVVFDASAKSCGNPSLNEILYKGLCLNPQLYDLLLKFRIYPIAMVADIEKAYLQILVDESHRDFLLFLWYKDIFDEVPEICKYSFCTVIFGATCSQFLLNGTIRTHAKKYEAVDPEFARKVRKHFYVDDLNTGVTNVDEGLDLYKKIKVRFIEANFNLRKWRTNNEELRNIINKNENNNKEEVIDKNKEEKNNNGCFEKVLGIKWDENKDLLLFDIMNILKKSIELPPTKRNILKLIASIYDPVGYLQPVIVKFRLLFQEICLSNIGWDDHIGELINRWEQLMESLKINIKINRKYFVSEIKDPMEEIYLHGFSDASENAYACCIYLKAVARSGNVSISFVTSKSRVVPIKRKFSIPRLELLENYILARLKLHLHLIWPKN